MYSVTNTGKNRRHIYDARHRLVAIDAGQTHDNVYLEDGAAEYIAKRNGTLKIERMEILAPPEVVPVQPVGEQDEPAVRTPAQLLVSVRDEMPYAQLRREAARTLGDEWPGGKPSREEIVKLLNAKMGF